MWYLSNFSCNFRFLTAITNAYFARARLPTARNFSKSPKKPKVHAGGQWLERRSASQAIETLLRHQDGLRDVLGLLTPRELKIVPLVAQGCGNKSIAGALCISEGTVKIHLHHIYKKLGIASRLALTLYARDNGLV